MATECKSLIKILAFPVAMTFIVYRYMYEDHVKTMFLTSQAQYCAKKTRLRSYEGLHLKSHVIDTHVCWESRGVSNCENSEYD